jgi:hypothetical protein
MLRLSYISIQDTFGVQSVKFRPGTITRLKGPNGSGKSSVMRGFLRCFDGGHDPSIIRRGAEKSIFEFGLTDGTVVTRVCEPKRRRRGDDASAPVQYKTSVEITDSDGTVREAPATYLKELGEPVAIDPGRLLSLDVTTAPGLAKFTEEIQKAMPLVWTPEEITAAMQRPALKALDQHGNPVTDNRPAFKLDVSLPTVEQNLDLKGIKKYIAAVTEARRRVGHTRDDADGAINSAQKSLPPDDGIDCSVELRKAELTRDNLQTQHAARRVEAERLKADAMTEARGVQAKRNSEIDAEINCQVREIDQDIDRQIRELERQRADRKATAERERSERKAVTSKTFDDTRTAIDEAMAEELAAIEREIGGPLQAAITDIATLKQRVEESMRAKFTREQIERNTEKFRAASRQYDSLTEYLERLEAGVRRKLEELPVPGLVVDEVGVTLDGIPWQHVNTAKRVEVVLQLCSLRSGKLGVLFLDDAEHLTTETMHALEEGIAAAGYQLVEAEVSEECECGHDHPRGKNGGVDQACALCSCCKYVAKPLRIETFEPIGA